MASPPNMSSFTMPKKRGSISSLSSAQIKKRKPSQLRNAYSPETEGAGSPARYSRSPSMDSVATTSVINGVGGKKRRKKGTKPTANGKSPANGPDGLVG